MWKPTALANTVNGCVTRRLERGGFCTPAKYDGRLRSVAKVYTTDHRRLPLQATGEGELAQFWIYKQFTLLE